MWCVQRCYVLINNGLCIRHKGTIGPPHRSLWKRPSCRCVSSPAVGWLGSICFWKCRLMWRLCKDSGLLYFLLFSWSVEKGKKKNVWDFSRQWKPSSQILKSGCDLHGWTKKRILPLKKKMNHSRDPHLFWVNSGSVSLRVGSERNRSSPEELIIAETLQRKMRGDSNI